MTFENLGLAPSLVRKIAEQGMSEPTPIQAKAIPLALKGRDVLGIAQTGTGKTAAFGLPLLHKLFKTKGKKEPKAVGGLILAPTRELVAQISDSLAVYSHGTHLRVTTVVGGASISAQMKRLNRGTNLLVATPGRLIDLIERKAVRLDLTRYLVLDEADQMLDMGFIQALRRIAPLLPKDRQTMLFSATMPKLMTELSGAYLSDPVRIEITPPGKPADKVTQSVHFTEKAGKTKLLVQHLGEHPADLSLVFTRTNHGADRLTKALAREGFAAAAIHGNKSQGQRQRTIKAFKSSELKILVATDVAARGLDIPGVRQVYNYDLPNVPENYVHRIGRTARAGRDGYAVAYCAPEELADLKAIQKTIGREIPAQNEVPWARSVSESRAKPDTSKPPRPKRHTRRKPCRNARRAA
ncbi:MAG: DEAD/DEAH box helicase [Pseudomonadota bacterium]